MSAKTAMPNYSHATFLAKIDNSWSGLSGKLNLGVVFLTIGVLAGCSKSEPFPLAQISGKVTYSDGSLIKASRIQIICQPIDAEAQGNISPRGAKGTVDPKTGEFTKLTTWKTGDGVICGRNKVAIVPIRVGKDTDAMGRSDKGAVDSTFFSTKSTTLEIEVVAGGENHFVLEVERPKK